MFIVNLTYIKPLEEVEKHLQQHIIFLEQHYKKGYFIASGRKNPRTGGIILAKANHKKLIQEIITQVPFYQNEIAQYDIIEFEASKYCPEFETIISKPFDDKYVY